MDDDLLGEQRAYYRGHAPRYDQWWQRTGPYDHGADVAAEWDRQIAGVESALDAFGPSGDVLELAGGTGWWTQRLARTADHLTVVDASPETLELNRARVGRSDVDYLVADLFTWQPEHRYDVVFFSFWLSHVPRDRFGSFWQLVASALRPGGRVFVIDNRADPFVADEPEAEASGRDPHVSEYRTDEHLRRLADGTELRVVKVMYEPAELTGLLTTHGWDADLDATRWFIFGTAAPHPPAGGSAGR